ncbi:hypothetical protein L245_13325, partial [Salmonella enterica subsp. enterica serovar Worthington str. BCH-4719]
MRDETKEAMRMFLGGCVTSAENLERDYLAEVVGYSDDRWEAPQRAARLAAAVKRFPTVVTVPDHFCQIIPFEV